MPEPSRQTIIERIEGLRALTASQHEENVNRLQAIERQTRETNGRVTKLERWQIAIISGSTVILFVFGSEPAMQFLRNLLGS